MTAKPRILLSNAGVAAGSSLPARPARRPRWTGWTVPVLAMALTACASTGGSAPAAVAERPGALPDSGAALPAAGSNAHWAPAPAPGMPGSAAAPVPDLAMLRPPVRTRYRELQTRDGRVFLLDPARSDIRIYAFRAGAAARFGHDHVIAVPRFSGLAWAPPKGLRGGTADFGFRLVDLAVDPPALRAETGGAFGSALDAEAVQGTYRHLIGEQGFDAASHPWIEASATIETGEVPLAIADLALSLHGETHHQRVVLHVAADERHLEVSGALVFRQGDFGIKPYAVMGGLLAVDQLVAVEFHLRGTPLDAPLP